MPKTVDIKCFPIAQTAMNYEARDRWLSSLGVNADLYDGADTHAEDLIGAAGKRCYMSFEPGLNKNITKIRKDWTDYFDNILKSGHGSVFEHATWTWAIEGCSRVFTGEMNRHRAGVAISEGSMRYIRFDNIGYWLPLSIAPVDGLDEDEQARRQETRLLFESVFTKVECAYRELERIWDINNMKDFKRKKQLTSMFRRIIPMGVATGGLWTFNGRALRHIMALRTTPEAEEEIAYVVGMIAKHMVETECRLFGDFENRDGCWVPKYQKV